MRAASLDPLIVLGAGHAGGRAALTLRAEGYRGRLLLIGNEHQVPYERPSLSKGLLLGKEDLKSCSLATPERYAELNIEFTSSRPVAALDPTDHCLRFADGAAQPYSGLLLAMGGRVRRLPGVSDERAGVFYLRSYEDSVRLRERLRPGAHLVVVGGGFIGLEVAATARLLGCSVTLLEAGRRLAGRALPARLSQALYELHLAKGVDVRLDTAIESLDGVDHVEAVRLVSGECIPCDAVLVGIGMQPNVELAQAAGLATGSGVQVDDRLRTSAPDVYAAGDVCEFRLSSHAPYQRQETWRNAEAQGRHAALNLLGRDLIYRELPAFWSDQYDRVVKCVGSLTDAATEVTREQSEGFLQLFLDDQHRLQGACSWAVGTTGAKDIKVCEHLIASGMPLMAQAIGDVGIPLKHWLRN